MTTKQLRRCEFIGSNHQDGPATPTGVPLKHQEIIVTVDNSIAVIDLVQTFQNDKSYPMEVSLKFPTEADHTLSNLTIQIGENIIEGKILKKEKAKEKYEDAIAGGNTAVMAEEKEDEKDVVSLKVGNLLAGQEAIIRFKFTTILKVEMGAYVLKIPQSFFPLCDADYLYSFIAEIQAQSPITYVSAPENAVAIRSDEKPNFLTIER
jgi:hypothetical protein